MNNVFIYSAKKDEVVENFAKSKREELEKMIPGFVDDRKLTDIVLNFYERGIRDGVQMMLEQMTDIIAARNTTNVSVQMSEASASGKLNDAFNEKKQGGLTMEEYEKYLIIYGYVLPMAIMLVCIMWRVCSGLKAGERYVSRFIRDCWPLLIPGVSLCGVCSLLLLASVECSHWLERHWGVWRMAGEQSRSIARRMLGGRQKECPNHQPLIKAEKETDLEVEYE